MFVPLDLLRVYIIYGQVDVIGFLMFFFTYKISSQSLSNFLREQ